MIRLIGLVVLITAQAFANAQVREQANPNQRCVPNFENGQPAGYNCFDEQPSGQYEKLGLKNGDVITGVDGQSASDPAKALELLKAKPKKVQITRNGQKETITYEDNRGEEDQSP
jgi:type II secretory pathway component PulC